MRSLFYYSEIHDLEAQKKFFHSEIVIENNTFEMFDQSIVYAKSTNGLNFIIYPIEMLEAEDCFHPLSLHLEVNFAKHILHLQDDVHWSLIHIACCSL